MTRIGLLVRRLGASLCLAGIAGAIYAASLILVAGADTNAVKVPKPAQAAPPAQKTAKKPAQKKLSGSELYAVHCNRCHPERYPTEFTAAQWKTIMLEMRVRANLPADQSKAILKYLQTDSGTP